MTRPINDDADRTFVGGRYPYLDHLERNGSLAKFAQDVEIPKPGEDIPWNGSLRTELPQYVVHQFQEAAHRLRCTQVSLILQLMAAHRDADGQRVFYIRPEDLVADRRKVRRARG